MDPHPATKVMLKQRKQFIRDSLEDIRYTNTQTFRKIREIEKIFYDER
tara:strand:+ start:921 stop:1064 length:144 start_codon:yes stop_codon:yes gene_type:complete